MKRLFLFLLIIVLLLFGCGCSKETAIDQLTDGSNYYQNKDLGFTIALPVDFEYYQTQRKETSDYVDIEFFVPTSDTNYYQEVPSYAKPITIRVSKDGFWRNITEDNEDKLMYVKLGEKAEKVYAIKFWQEIPDDWQNKWSEDMRKNIIESFKIK